MRDTPGMDGLWPGMFSFGLLVFTVAETFKKQGNAVPKALEANNRELKLLGLADGVVEGSFLKAEVCCAGPGSFGFCEVTVPRTVICNRHACLHCVLPGCKTAKIHLTSGTLLLPDAPLALSCH